MNELKLMRKYDDTNSKFTIDESNRSRIIEIIQEHGGIVNNPRRDINGLFSLAMYFVNKAIIERLKMLVSHQPRKNNIKEINEIYKYIRLNLDNDIITLLTQNNIRIPLDTIIETDEEEKEEYNGGLRSILKTNHNLRRKSHCYSRRKCIRLIHQRRNGHKSRRNRKH
jgi:hypothetical protein